MKIACHTKMVIIKIFTAIKGKGVKFTFDLCHPVILTALYHCYSFAPIKQKTRFLFRETGFYSQSLHGHPLSAVDEILYFYRAVKPLSTIWEKHSKTKMSSAFRTKCSVAHGSSFMYRDSGIGVKAVSR